MSTPQQNNTLMLALSGGGDACISLRQAAGASYVVHLAVWLTCGVATMLFVPHAVRFNEPCVIRFEFQPQVVGVAPDIPKTGMQVATAPAPAAAPPTAISNGATKATVARHMNARMLAETPHRAPRKHAKPGSTVTDTPAMTETTTAGAFASAAPLIDIVPSATADGAPPLAEIKTHTNNHDAPSPITAANMQTYSTSFVTPKLATHSAAVGTETNTAIIMDQYLDDMRKRLGRAWFPPTNCDGRAGSVVHFKLNQDGSVSDLRISKASTVHLDDVAALRAVEMAYLRPLPAGSPESIEIEFTFNWNMFLHTRKSQPFRAF